MGLIHRRAYVVVTFVVTIGLLAIAPARAVSPFVVNSVDDPGNGVCDATQCTLAEAINAANGALGTDEIDFSIPGSGLHTIAPVSELPHITDPVTINGYTQTGASVNTLAATDNAVLRVVLDGENSGSGVTGLWVESGGSGSVIEGLNINHFDGNAILTYNATSVTVTGNFIGTDPTGTAARSNFRGIYFNGGNGHTLGGPSPAARNIISGNLADGAEVGGTLTSIQGNFIGVRSDGTSALGNGSSGLNVEAGKVDIGGLASAARNVIAFNGFATVDSFNDGITLYSGNQSPILRNSIFSNRDLGIDLDANGRTPNDALDADNGSNDLQNYPVLKRATTVGTTTKVRGVLKSTPSTAFTVQFFANPSTDRKQGKQFLGELTGLTTDSFGKASFAFTSPTTVAPGQYVTATATDALSNTSEFSVALKVVRP